LGLQYRAKKKRKNLLSTIAASATNDDKEENIDGQTPVGISNTGTALICKLDLTKEQLDFQQETDGKGPQDLKGDEAKGKRPLVFKGQETVGKGPHDLKGDETVGEGPQDFKGDETKGKRPLVFRGHETVGEGSQDLKGHETKGKRAQDLKGHETIGKRPQVFKGDETVGKEPSQILPTKVAPSSSFFIGGLDETEEANEEMPYNEVERHFFAEKKRTKKTERGLKRPKIVDETEKAKPEIVDEKSDQNKLHPSWTAAVQKRKRLEISKGQKGKKTKFEDD